MDNFSVQLQNLDFVHYGFKETGIVEARETEDQAESDEDPFQDLN